MWFKLFFSPFHSLLMSWKKILFVLSRNASSHCLLPLLRLMKIKKTNCNYQVTFQKHKKIPELHNTQDHFQLLLQNSSFQKTKISANKFIDFSPHLCRRATFFRTTPKTKKAEYKIINVNLTRKNYIAMQETVEHKCEFISSNNNFSENDFHTMILQKNYARFSLFLYVISSRTVCLQHERWFFTRKSKDEKYQKSCLNGNRGEKKSNYFVVCQSKSSLFG